MKNIKHLFNVLLFCMVLSPALTFAQDFFVGVNAHLYAKKESDISSSINKIKAIGFSSVRIDVPWKVVEKKRGVYEIPSNWDFMVDYALKNGLSVLLILDYGNKLYDNGDKPTSNNAVAGFRNYVDFVTKHFEGRVQYYQIWNEWNSRDGDTKPGSVADYKKLVKAVYPIIKKNDNHSLVITSSFSPAAFNKAIGIENKGDYLKDYLSKDMSIYTDALSIHPYTTYRKPPFDRFDFYTKQIDYAMNLVQGNKYFKDKPVFITEIGWTTAKSRYGVSYDEQAINIKKAICEAKARGYAGVYIYDFKDDGTNQADPEQGFGVLNNNMTMKKSAEVIEKYDCSKSHSH
ncbi:hypothetical protein FE839_05695 [Klebsiella indica]|uniref:Glycoside hydrolase family 5 domain-containing protein n=1 Tax=Klebsiella indica TaxID=2582917 RepID=A0A5R9LLQ9_9ENTR|nr:cellulase family glycosylhydrolase [Klebsiella indica]TLV21526.1 hypothetical protein FE839_05695 [Klebsiella indica]